MASVITENHTTTPPPKGGREKIVQESVGVVLSIEDSMPPPDTTPGTDIDFFDIVEICQENNINTEFDLLDWFNL